jgi:WD40 repeat protein
LHDEPKPPRRLNDRIPRDLETVCLKALAKEPGRRYATAGALAEDLRRYLEGKPIAARPMGAVERGWRWCRRNPVVAGLVAAVALALVLGTAVATYFAIQAHGREQDAVGSARRADLNAAEAKANAQQADLNAAEAKANAQQADLNAAEARANAQQAIKEKEIARDNLNLARRHLYVAHLNLAQNAWHEDRIGRVLDLLNEERPKVGQEDLRGFEWFYLWRLCHSERLTLKHKRYAPRWQTDCQVTSVAFSPDGQRLASAGAGVFSAVWDAGSGQQILTLLGGTRVAFSPDGKRVASPCADGTVRLWEVVGSDLPQTQLEDHGIDGTVQVYDATLGREVLSLKGHTDMVSDVVFSPDGKRLVSAGGGWNKPGEVKLWDATTGQVVLTLTGHTGSVNRVAFSPDGKRLASAGEPVLLDAQGKRLPGEVKVWDIGSGQEVLSLKAHTGSVNCLAFSPDGKRLASAGGSHDVQGRPLPGEVKVWDAGSGQEVLSLKAHTPYVSSVAFSADGKRLASAGDRDHTVKLWDAQTGQVALTLKGHTGGVGSVAFSPDGQRLASGGGSREGVGEVKVWDATMHQEALTLKGHTGGVASVAFSGNGQRLASAGGHQLKPGELKIWDVTTGEEALSVKGHPKGITSMALSPDGKRLASASADFADPRTPGEVKVWDATTGQEILTLKGHTGRFWGVAFSPDGQRLATASGGYDADWRLLPGIMKVWSAAQVRQLPGEVKVWDAATGKEVLTLKGHTGRVQSVTFSADGKRLASGGYATERRPLPGEAYTAQHTPLPAEVRVWDATTGKEVLTLKGHTGNVLSVAFSPDGKRLASAGDDGMVKVWDTATGQAALTLTGHTGMVLSVAFSPDGKRLASASQDGTVKVWDTTTGQETITLKGHTDQVNSVAFSPDGQRLASASSDDTVKVWNATPAPGALP